ncbi:MAG: hypothetical protein PHW19_02795 [Salinivirgaceae bacterium]|nr:hypothetical protein [Salinivirgaceae bacterium]
MSTRLFIFNPTNEIAIADGGNGYVPNRQLAEFERDLDTLPFVFANADDIVLVQNEPDAAWLNVMSPIAHLLPQFLCREEIIQKLKSKEITIAAFHPWGWSPRMVRIVTDFMIGNQKALFNNVNSNWSPNHQKTYGRETALHVLREVIEHCENPDLFINKDQFPQRIVQLSEVDTLLFQTSRIVFKSPYSASGRGVLMLNRATINESNRLWIQSQIKKSGYVMVESFLEIVHECSLHFKMDATQCKPVAFSFFDVTEKGSYGGSYVNSAPVRQEVMDFLDHVNIPSLARNVGNALFSQGVSTVYNGYLGVDMIISRNPEGDLYFQPCVEINMRYNMGTVAHFLSKILDDDVFGFFKIVSNQDSNTPSVEAQMVQNPPIWKNCRLRKGVLPLTPHLNRSHVAIVEVFESDTLIPRINFNTVLRG